jgi:hypothetical protein
MSDNLRIWIRKFSDLSDNQLKEYLNTIHGNSVNSFLRAIENASSTKEHRTLSDFPHSIKELDSAGNEALQNLKLEGLPPSFFPSKTD